MPYPSGLDYYINLKRAEHKKIVTSVGLNKTTEKFRIDIAYLELIVKHLIVNPALQLQIERIWSRKKELVYTYNRLDISQYTLPGGSLSYLTPNLFEGMQVPPIFFGNQLNILKIIYLFFFLFLVFFQSQKREVYDIFFIFFYFTKLY